MLHELLSLTVYVYRYQERISRDIRTRYSTLVNILLHRGDLDKELIPAAINTLAKGTEKEDFYKKFERTEDLWALYREEKRYHDAFKLALSQGMFDDALRLGEEPSTIAVAGFDNSKTAIPISEYLTLFNGLMGAHAWSSIQFNLRDISKTKTGLPFPPTLPLPPALGQGQAATLRGPRSGWAQILDCILSARQGLTLHIPRPEASTYFFREFGSGFLDLLVSYLFIIYQDCLLFLLLVLIVD